MSAPLPTAQSALSYMLAGNATVTLVSRRTGARFTYRVRAPKAGGDVRFVGVLNGSDNTGDYAFLGTLFPDGYQPGRKSRVAPTAPSSRALVWALGKLAAGDMPAELEIWHEGRCGRCGRKLTVPSSIETGLGPECAGKV